MLIPIIRPAATPPQSFTFSVNSPPSSVTNLPNYHPCKKVINLTADFNSMAEKEMTASFKT
ncbi:MAG: hypothetical protein ACOY16_06840 [Chloroflexota bacterium]